MSNYRIITDSCSDLPLELVAELDIDMVYMTLLHQGQEIIIRTDEQSKEIYNGLRNGETPTTAAVNPEGWRAAIEPVLASGKDALVMSFSSGLSTTYQSAVIAAQELMEEYPGRTVKVLDTLAASLGQGMYVWYACKKRDEGLSLEELYDWCEEHKQNIAHWVTVDDLMHLKRGGRISGATAMVGTMLGIKPLIHVDENGKLINVGKVRGRKAALDTVAKKLAEDGLPGENDTVFIGHGDCIEDAEYVAKICKEKYGVKNVIIGYIGAVIGSHSGPGTIAFFFLANHR